MRTDEMVHEIDRLRGEVAWLQRERERLGTEVKQLRDDRMKLLKENTNALKQLRKRDWDAETAYVERMADVALFGKPL